MIQRRLFCCGYDGTNYSGWQIQPNAITIQGVIEEYLSKLYDNQKIAIVGCGRTDAGVHAHQSFFHVDLDDRRSNEQLLFKLNYMLPKDIVIYNIIPVNDDFHARFDAISRTYHYYIHTFKSPFIEKFSWFYPRPLSVEKMNDACQYLLGRKDFTSFSKLHTDVNNNFCEVFSANWTKVENQLVFEITANRFLRNMVRAIVGTLVEVGKESIPPDDILLIIKSKNRNKAGFSVPAKGLFIEKVAYDSTLFSEVFTKK